MQQNLKEQAGAVAVAGPETRVDRKMTIVVVAGFAQISPSFRLVQRDPGYAVYRGPE